MKRELFLHFAFWFSFFILITLSKGHFNLAYWPFWLGGIAGTFLPDIDHLIYVYFTKPQELTSQRVNYLVGKKELIKSVAILYETRSQRSGLIFHSVYFQLLFFVLMFWIMSSSSSIFGKGLALAFGLHLLIDQIVDIVEMGNFDNWLKFSPINLSFKNAKIYWAASLLVVFLLGFLL